MPGHDRWKWLTALGLFSVFGAINLHQGWEGRTSCGCFGPVQANPWMVLGVDAVAVALLLLFRPQSNEALFRWNDLRTGLLFVAKPTLALGLFFGAVYLAFGSFDRAIAQLRGQTYSLDTLVDFGEGKPGEHKEAALTVTNWSRQPLRIVGGSSKCFFHATKDLPLTVAQGKTEPLQLLVTLPLQPGRFTHSGYLMLDDNGLEYAHFKITGVVLP